MNKEIKSNKKGFTLIEILLVLTIVSVIFGMAIVYLQQKTQAMRIDRGTLQMQQVLNAALAYYVAKGAWPVPATGIGTTLYLLNQNSLLATEGYIPITTALPFKSPWGLTYQIGATNSNFYIFSSLVTYPRMPEATMRAIGTQLSGRLPLSFTTTSTSITPTQPGNCSGSGSCFVVASVTVPGQNLNQADAVRFANLYHHGGCVPVPECPFDPGSGARMKAEIIVVPVSVSGLNDVDTSTPGNIYPISSFSAYATGNGTGANPPACSAGAEQVACDPVGTATNYWRACLEVVTEKGLVKSDPGNTAWGQYVTLLAVTRCAITNEPSGSPFTVYSN